MTTLVILITSYFLHRLYLPFQLFSGHGIIWIRACSSQSYCLLRCHPQLRPPNINEAAKLYDDVIVNLLDCNLLGQLFVALGHLTHGSTPTVDSPSFTLAVWRGRPRLIVACLTRTLLVHLLLPLVPGPNGVLVASFDTGNALPSGLWSSLLPLTTRDRSVRLLTGCLFVSRLMVRRIRYILRLRMVSVCLLSVMSHWLISLPP